MSTPDEIRAEIERTRGDLGYNVDALADKVSPSSIAHRQTEKVKTRFQNARESVMGAADSARSSVMGAADSAKSSVTDSASGATDAAHRGVQKAKGNPLAVGLIAFGAGWLVSSLIPTTDKEEELAGELKEQAAPLVDKVKSQAKDMGSQLGDAAKEHAQDLKETAQDAAQTVKDEAQDAASDVHDHVQTASSSIHQS